MKRGNRKSTRFMEFITYKSYVMFDYQRVALLESSLGRFRMNRRTWRVITDLLFGQSNTAIDIHSNIPRTSSAIEDFQLPCWIDLKALGSQLGHN